MLPQRWAGATAGRVPSAMPSAAGTSIDWLPPGPQIIQGRPLDVDDVHVRRECELREVLQRHDRRAEEVAFARVQVRPRRPPPVPRTHGARPELRASRGVGPSSSRVVKDAEGEIGGGAGPRCSEVSRLS